MPMVLVVPGKEAAAEAARVLLRAKPARKFSTVLQRLELTFRKRIIVRDVRPTEASAHAQLGEQQRHRFGSHRRAAIRKNDQVAQSNDLYQHTFQATLLG